MSQPLVASSVSKTFEEQILNNIDFSASKGETIAIVGPSGSGKSTLLHILGGIEQPDAGTISVLGKAVTKSSAPDILNKDVGYLFQSFHLFDDFDVMQNILLPAFISGAVTQEATDRVQTILKEVNLFDKKHALAKHLSGGEKQRVALVRALCNDPSILLCDEPTGNLDPTQAHEVQTLLLNLAKKHGKTVIIVTHNLEFAQRCDTVYTLDNRKLNS